MQCQSLKGWLKNLYWKFFESDKLRRTQTRDYALNMQWIIFCVRNRLICSMDDDCTSMRMFLLITNTYELAATDYSDCDNYKTWNGAQIIVWLWILRLDEVNRYELIWIITEYRVIIWALGIKFISTSVRNRMMAPWFQKGLFIFRMLGLLGLVLNLKHYSKLNMARLSSGWIGSGSLRTFQDDDNDWLKHPQTFIIIIL